MQVQPSPYFFRSGLPLLNTNLKTFSTALNADPRIAEANPDVAKRARLHTILDELEEEQDFSDDPEPLGQLVTWVNI